MSEELLNKAAEAGVVGAATAVGYNEGAAAPNLFSQNVDNVADAGLLNPEQASAFIDYMWDATTLAKEGRRIQMRSTVVDIDKIAIGQNVIRNAAESDGAYSNAAVQFTKITVTTKKLRLDWETSTELVEDGIDTSVDDHILVCSLPRLVTTSRIWLSTVLTQALHLDLTLSTDSLHRRFPVQARLRTLT